ncbi:phosphoglucosamine mutase [Roseomonas elaeocarpi]|uniref:Phosphoglucosamine mutase n=1 Tax=Roseomonas elaeocarpi TaxID=907779 RepID=A0ABV6JQV0_9PROT
MSKPASAAPAARKLFGTDGVRGVANRAPMDAATALRLGQAAGQFFNRGGHRHRVVVGKDTRLSGYMLEPALTAGFVGAGMDVVLVGPLPTPAIAMLTRSLRADLGVMISASHNPYEDNGIKLFGPDGLKLSDAQEGAIEALMAGDLTEALAAPARLGRASRLEDAPGRYIEAAKSAFPKGLTLSGMRIVVDCANGAAYRVAPTVLWELGAEVVPLGVAPDGFNINSNCGSTAPARMAELVRERRADLGIALDGDADRLVMCDEGGNIVDGDQILALIGETFAAQGRLRGGSVVATVMSNLGLERRLASKGIGLQRTKVGDRYVGERMRESGCNVGGEQSGHLILSDHGTTGDGLVAALQVLAAITEEGRPASAVCRRFEPLPQKLVNIRHAGGDPLSDPAVSDAIRAAEAELGSRGRVLIRPSGTEPLIRVMAEAEEESVVEAVVTQLADTIRAVAAAPRRESAAKAETGVGAGSEGGTP